MPNTNIELRKLSLSADKLKGLTAQERYVFALAGHVFNELMMLQKMVIISTPAPEAHAFTNDAAVGSALFVLRILIGKTEEAMRMLSKQSVAEVLRQQIFARVAGLEEKWSAVLSKYQSMPWLGTIRNQRAFHYMNAAQWSPHLNDDICHEAYVIVGKTYGTTLFHWQEMSAGLPMMKLVDEEAPFHGLALMIEELGKLLGELGECIAVGLQTYMLEALTDEDALGPPEIISGPALNETHLQYFYAKD